MARDGGVFKTTGFCCDTVTTTITTQHTDSHQYGQFLGRLHSVCADDEYCMSWTPWEMADARKKWNELVMSSMQRDPSYYISQNSIPAECKLAALKGQSPTQGTNHGRGSAGSAHYHGSLNKKGNHHGDYTDTTPSTNSESRYTVDGVDGTEAGPRSLVQNLTSPDVHDYAIWHWNADDGTKNARMKDPAPMYELCDFMNFTLENVAILAPVGGLLARDWAIPRQRRVHPLPSGISGTGSGAVDHGNDPRITIRGSIFCQAPRALGPVRRHRGH